MMTIAQANASIAEAQILWEENKALKERLAKLGETSINISANPETEAVLRALVNNA